MKLFLRKIILYMVYMYYENIMFKKKKRLEKKKIVEI